MEKVTLINGSIEFARQTYADLQTAITSLLMPHLGIHMSFCRHPEAALSRLFIQRGCVTRLLDKLLSISGLTASQSESVSKLNEHWINEQQEMTETLAKLFEFGGRLKLKQLLNELESDEVNVEQVTLTIV